MSRKCPASTTSQITPPSAPLVSQQVCYHEHIYGSFLSWTQILITKLTDCVCTMQVLNWAKGSLIRSPSFWWWDIEVMAWTCHSRRIQGSLLSRKTPSSPSMPLRNFLSTLSNSMFRFLSFFLSHVRCRFAASFVFLHVTAGHTTWGLIRWPFSSLVRYKKTFPSSSSILVFWSKRAGHQRWLPSHFPRRLYLLGR